MKQKKIDMNERLSDIKQTPHLKMDRQKKGDIIRFNFKRIKMSTK